MCLAALRHHLRSRPYRDPKCDTLQAIVFTQLLLTYIFALLHHAGSSELPAADAAAAKDWMGGLVLIGINLAGFIYMLSICAYSAWRVALELSMVRLSAGRESMSEATQALCFTAGANSIFTGDKLLTAANAGDDADAAMLQRLGLKAMVAQEPMRACKAMEAAE